MQRQSKRHQPHPAETVSEVVFEVCCRTLAALRFPFQFDEQAIDTEPDFEYQEEWQKLEKSPQPLFAGRELDHPIDHVEWDALLDSMNRPNWNDRHHHELAVRHQAELLHTARIHPQCLLSVAMRQACELVPDHHVRFRETPPDAARPFPLPRVLGWLSALDLIEVNEGRYRAKAACFQSMMRLRRSNLGLETIRKVAEWATGPLGPSASHLHFHLRGLDGKPTCSRDILHVQALSASPETHLALLHMLPRWGNGRRRILRDMIVARWIRSMEVFGGTSTFKAESAAHQVMRWTRLCEHLKGIPRVEFHALGSSAGF
jgi:uncharacterized protein YndB with AHSA1/START domain